ncbi:hypothetical protein LJY25_14660 [Hymenobacter sp. BT175]|uniref:hypothetical protein n=1 Tax=Hymenobacter translucens TaxID=2886507 RepID=UPI001D0E6DD0|nr:hypothetical protein [Hymenobacter translucens]MCC2547694.1 hypothetical protein [Hymenobacter translucens]
MLTIFKRTIYTLMIVTATLAAVTLFFSLPPDTARAIDNARHLLNTLALLLVPMTIYEAEVRGSNREYKRNNPSELL